MPATKINNLDFIYELCESVKKHNLNYIYRGDFSHKLTNRIISLAESNFEKTKERTKIKKKVYYVMVESLQNITVHKDKCVEDTPEHSDCFIIQRIDNDYFVTSGNLIDNKDIKSLKTKLDTINNLNKERLNSYYQEIITEGKITEKGGAGLGLIEMARKSGNKLVFDFKFINAQFAFFYLQTKIPVTIDSSQAGPGKIKSGEGYDENLEAAKNFHQMILDRNIQLAYQGEFTQENVKRILSITEDNMEQKDESLINKKVFNIIVELLQNIYNHAYSPEGKDDDKSGVFFIVRENGGYFLTTCNMVLNEKIDVLKAGLERVNMLGFTELRKLYKQIMIQEDNTEESGSGLGFIDMKTRSGNNLLYNLKPAGNDCSFLSLQVKI